MPEIEVYLSTPQYRKITKNAAVQLSAKDLLDGTNKHAVNLFVTNAFYRKFNRAIKNSRGIRLSKDDVEIEGGSITSIFGKLAKSIPLSFIRKVGEMAINEGLNRMTNQTVGSSILGKMKSVKKLIPKNTQKQLGNLVMKQAINHLPDNYKDFGNQIGQVVVDQVVGQSVFKKLRKAKNIIPKNIQKSVGNYALKNAVNYMPDEYKDLGNQIGQAGVNAVVGQSVFSKLRKAKNLIPKNIQKSVGNYALKNAVGHLPEEYQHLGNQIGQVAVNQAVGSSIKRKGSQAAKDRMAELRARKKTNKKVLNKRLLVGNYSNTTNDNLDKRGLGLKPSQYNWSSGSSLYQWPSGSGFSNHVMPSGGCCSKKIPGGSFRAAGGNFSTLGPSIITQNHYPQTNQFPSKIYPFGVAYPGQDEFERLKIIKKLNEPISRNHIPAGSGFL